MRLAIALTLVGLGFGSALAEPVKRTATVDVDGVEIRSGHAMGFPAVGQLRKGDTVIVVREEETGFFAILPPAGSVSWIKQIHLGKVEYGDGGKANVPVAVDGAEVMAGASKEGKPTNRVTARLPRGTIVEIVGPAVRVDNSSWYPITPPEGDLRWLPKSALRAASMSALAPPAPYVKPETSPFTVAGSGGKPDGAARTAAAALPRVLTDHRLWAQAAQAEKNGEYATARTLYARIYQDLWDQKAERDAIVICYNRYTRCDEAAKKGAPAPPKPGERSDSRKPPGDSTSLSATSGGKWSSGGYLKELQKVFLDGKPVFSFSDDRDVVIYYVTGVSGINLRNYSNKRVELYGIVEERPELYRPHMAVERVEVAK
jgi:hypothetical protein